MSRDSDILGQLPLVRAIAAARHQALPWRYVQLEDLVSDGIVGLIYAVDHYDPLRGTLATYAEPRIRGAMTDGLRVRDIVTRSHREAIGLGLSGLVQNVDIAAAATCASAGRNPEQLASDSALWAMVATLKPRPRAVLEMFYHEGMYGVEIAAVLGVGESWISQIRARALADLREMLNKGAGKSSESLLPCLLP